MLQYKALPNKWIRKAVFDTLDGIVVDGIPIKFFDQRIPVENAPEAYVIMDSQSVSPAKDTKCEWNWNAVLNMEAIVQLPKSGNSGSRLLINNVTDTVVQAFNVLFALDAGSGLNVIRQNVETGTDFVSVSGGYLIKRQPIICTFYVI